MTRREAIILLLAAWLASALTLTIVDREDEPKPSFTVKCDGPNRVVTSSTGDVAVIRDLFQCGGTKPGWADGTIGEDGDPD